MPTTSLRVILSFSILLLSQFLWAKEVSAEKDLNVDSTINYCLHFNNDTAFLQCVNQVIRDTNYTIHSKIELGEWFVDHVEVKDSLHASAMFTVANYFGQRLRKYGLIEYSFFFYRHSHAVYENYYSKYFIGHPEYINIGHLFGSQGDTESQLEYYRKAFEETRNFNPDMPWTDNHKAWAKMTLGNYLLWRNPDELDSAQMLINEAIDIWKNAGIDYRESGAIMYAYSKLASFILSQNPTNLDSARSLSDSILKWSIRDQLDTNQMYMNIMAGISYKSEDFDKALYWAKKMNRLAHEYQYGARNNDLISTSSSLLFEIYKALGNDSLSLFYLQEYYRYDDMMQNDQNQRALQNQKYEQERIGREKEQALRLSRERNKQLILGFTSLILLLTAAGAYNRMKFVSKSNNQLASEKKRSDELLLNILPSEVADELKLNGEAKARSFDQVSILFTDFVDFTAESSRLSAIDLVSHINEYFKEFDRIMERYGIEKIKTIGDAYMAAGGLQGDCHEKTEKVIEAALDMQDYIQKLANDNKVGPKFKMRAGIHTGPVVAGIVGVKKFQYDIWGDTVNTANRLEAVSEAGKVNISRATYELVKDSQKFRFTERGPIDVKGKGLLDMWYVGRSS